MNWHDYFTYDAEAGNLIWKERAAECFKNSGAFLMWNKRYSNKIAGCELRDSKKRPVSVHVCVNGKPFMAHRIIWEMQNGNIPKGLLIDHRDTNPFNNKLENLRLATPSQNSMNSKVSLRSSTGLKGVFKQPGTKNFSSYISVNGKVQHIGSYPTKGLAAVAHAKAAIRYHGAFARVTRSNAHL